MKGNGAEIQDGRNQDDAVEVHAVVLLQIMSERGGAESAVAFADQEFRGIPAIVAADVESDELRERFNILIDAPKILVLRFADSVAEAGADGIEEDHVGLVEQRAGIVGELIG